MTESKPCEVCGGVACEAKAHSVTGRLAALEKRVERLEPAKVPTCKAWCGGELVPDDPDVFGKHMDVDRYFCTKACQVAERPASPLPPVPAHEAWTLRRMMVSWRSEFERVTQAPVPVDKGVREAVRKVIEDTRGWTDEDNIADALLERFNVSLKEGR